MIGEGKNGKVVGTFTHGIRKKRGERLVEFLSTKKNGGSKHLSMRKAEDTHGKVLETHADFNWATYLFAKCTGIVLKMLAVTLDQVADTDINLVVCNVPQIGL